MRLEIPLRSVVLYFAFVFLALAGMVYASAIDGVYDNLRVWRLPDLLVLFAGLPFLLLQEKAGLPAFEGKSETGKRLLLIPLVTGAIFGLLDIGVFRLILQPQATGGLPPYLQPFPYSVFLFVSGAFEIEVFYRMIPLTLFCLAGKYLKDGKYFNTVFWIAAVLTSFREPLEQFTGGDIWLAVYSVGTGFAMNLLQAWWYRKNGFVASLVLRLGHYLLWHILLGIWVEFVIL